MAKPHTIGRDLVLSAVKEIIETVLQQNASSISRAVPLSQGFSTFILLFTPWQIS